MEPTYETGKLRRRDLGRLGLGAAAGLGLAPAARAQAAWPERPVRLVVPFGPGGAIDTLSRFEADAGLPFPERRLAAMDAGQAAGGDRRGQQSAALVLTTTEDFPDISLRVDDHPAPLDELRRLLALWRRDREPGLRTAPRKADPSGLLDLDAMEAGWRARGLDLRFRR